MTTKTGHKEGTEQDEDWVKIFDLFDKDKNGHITTEELGDVLRALDIDPTQSELKDAMKELDKDGNGVIEYHDFEAYMLKQERMSCKQKTEEMEKAFGVFDRNNDKFIDASELIRVVTCIGDKLTEQEAEEMIKVADVNKDGKIDYHEFAKFIAAPFCK